MKRILVIYHSADFDGIMSSLVCRKYLLQYKLQDPSITIELFGWNYGDTLPDLARLCENYEMIYAVDISFTAEMMNILTQSGKFFWIDHHITAIQDSETFGYSHCPGLRRIGTAACELTWEYLFRDQPTPLIVQYLGAWDVFDKGRFDWEGIVNPIQMACSERYGLIPQKWFKELDNLLTNSENCLDSLIHDGQIIYRYTQRRAESYVKRYGFEVLVAGKYKGICLLNATFGSTQFNSIISNYDCCVVVNRKSSDMYSISIYIEPEHFIEFNAGEYLKEFYNGGGHKNAAGGFLNFEQFKELVCNQRI